MKEDVEIVQKILLPYIRMRVVGALAPSTDYSLAVPNNSVDWDALTFAFLNYKKDPKALLQQITKLKRFQFENLSAIAEELYNLFLFEKLIGKSDVLSNNKLIKDLFLKIDDRPFLLNLISNHEDLFSIPDKLYDQLLDDIAEQFVLQGTCPPAERLLETENTLFKEKIEFFRALKSAVAKKERESILKDMDDLSISEELLTSVANKNYRPDLREKFKEWDKQLLERSKIKQEPKVIKWNKILYALAAIIVIGFFIWQPTQSSDKELYASYYEKRTTLYNDSFNLLETTILNSNERGDEYILGSYTKAESESAMLGLNYFREGNYDKAKKVLVELNPKAHSEQALFFLALSQLYTNEQDEAITNLEYLNSQLDFKFSEDVKFHLAMAYIKTGRKESKDLLKEIASSNSKFRDEAKSVLKKMRWF